MLGKSFVFGSLVAFSLLNNVAATTTEELFVMGLGTTIPPNARKGNVGLGDYGGLNPNAVSHLPEKDTKVKLSDQPNRLVSYYKKKGSGCNVLCLWYRQKRGSSQVCALGYDEW